MSARCAVVLAAGRGERLRPLTDHTPKALCPVGGVPLLDRALDRLAKLGLSGPADVAVNASWLADQVTAHVDGRAHRSVEPRALGTAGAIGRLRDWIDGRDVVVHNADAYLDGGDLAPFLATWDGDRIRLLVVTDEGPADFGAYRFAGMSLMSWRTARQFAPVPSELFVPWRQAQAAGRLDLFRYEGIFIDCGTPADYLAANLHASGSGHWRDLPLP